MLVETVSVFSSVLRCRGVRNRRKRANKRRKAAGARIETWRFPAATRFISAATNFMTSHKRIYSKFSC
jgi:hypothetical protein